MSSQARTGPLDTNGKLSEDTVCVTRAPSFQRAGSRGLARQHSSALLASVAILLMAENCFALPAPSAGRSDQQGPLKFCSKKLGNFRTTLIKMRLRNRPQIMELDDADIAMKSLFGRPQNMQEWVDLLTSMFPVWILVAVVLGLYQPKTVNWLHDEGITACVGATMVFTGMTLKPEDFVRILLQPSQVLCGCLCQYTLMPSTGYALVRLLGLPKDSGAGLILLASCPGGTSSNLITLIARGDVALSVLMTTASTMLAAVVTPALVSLLAGNLVRIDSAGLVKSTLQVVLVPVAVGLIFNQWLPGLSAFAKQATPLLSVVIVSLICGSVISRAAQGMHGSEGLTVLLAVFLLHSIGFLLGYKVPELLGYSAKVSRTTAIETGIQSCALAVVLATRHFPAPLLTALPGALSSPIQSILGSLLAMYWYMQDVKAEAKAKDAERKKKLQVKRSLSRPSMSWLWYARVRSISYSHNGSNGSGTSRSVTHPAGRTQQSKYSYAADILGPGSPQNMPSSAAAASAASSSPSTSMGAARQILM